MPYVPKWKQQGKREREREYIDLVKNYKFA
jgi:hypothetical protein